MITNNTQSLAALMHQFARNFAAKDIESIESLLTDDFSLLDPASGWIRGKDKVLGVIKKQFSETKFIEYKIIHAFEDGNTGILEFQITLDELVLYGVDFMQWEGGKMKELRCYYNPPIPQESGELKPFSDAAKSLIKGAVYEHYKGNRYKLISVGRHSETLEEVVVYQPLCGDQDIWLRPLSMFVENVELNGQSVPRFKKILEGA
ncbi:MAG: DUF1653 domain-containing protein [Simkaniaceae bacterium]|nr:DUF1653 domain-containing protein [Simkaniaceae bacterium]